MNKVTKVVAGLLALGAVIALVGLALIAALITSVVYQNTRREGTPITFRVQIVGAQPPAMDVQAIYEPNTAITGLNAPVIGIFGDSGGYDYEPPKQAATVTGDTLSVTVPRAFLSYRDEELRSVQFGDLGFGFLFSVSEHPLLPMPQGAWEGSYQSPLEAAARDGNVARFATRAATLPAYVSFPMEGIDTVEEVIDVSPWDVVSFGRQLAKAGADANVNFIEVDPGTDVWIEFTAARTRAGWPDAKFQYDVLPDAPVDVLVVSDAEWTSRMAWRAYQRRYVAITAAEWAQLAEHPVADVHAVVGEIEGKRAVHVTLDPGAKEDVWVLVTQRGPTVTECGARQLHVQ